MVKKQEKDSFFEKYKYPIIAIGGSVILALVIIFAIIRPMWGSTSNVLAELKTKKVTLVNLTEKLENLKKLKNKEAELKEKNAKVLAALPDDKDVARLFVQVEGVAAAGGMSVKQAGEGGADTISNNAGAIIKPVSYQVSATAPNYDSIKNTLLKFEQALRLLSISNLEVTKGGGSDLSASFTITTYVRSTK